MNFPTKIPSSQLAQLLQCTHNGATPFYSYREDFIKSCNIHLEQCRPLFLQDIFGNVFWFLSSKKLKNLETQKILILAKSNTISQTHWLHCTSPLSWSLLSGARVQHKLTSFCLVGKRGFHSKLEKARYQREQGKLLTLNDFLFRKHIAYFSLFI